MIASLRGVLIEMGDGGCVVEVGGVGYLVQISAFTARQLGEVGTEVRLRTRQIVREDSVQLFGFAEAHEIRLFDLLISVSGVGPRMALAALSGLDPMALAIAIRDEQVARLVTVPGIGRKTAERLVIELRDKLAGVLAHADSPSRVGPPGWETGPATDAVAALITLGYPRVTAEGAVQQVLSTQPTASLEAVVREALARLASPSLLHR